MEKLLKAHYFMMRRYRDIIEGKNFKDEEFLINFCNSSLTISNPDKLSRWVGYIQGVLIERSILDVRFERDLSREIYRPIYEELGYDTTTVEVKK
jgi:hypothetical protein